MCDCYLHKCKFCEEKLPVHLGNFETDRSEIEVFCEKHIPDHNVFIFTVVKVFNEIDGLSEEDKVYVGWKMGIRPLTENAKCWLLQRYNHPNLASDYETTFILSKGE